METKEFTVREFRMCTREALDLAEADVDVYIKRHGSRFILLPEDYYLEIMKPAPQPATVAVVEASKKPAVKPKSKTGFCKHGYALENRMCKFGCR